jgi:hypothetical protein
MSSIHLTFINNSNDANNSQIVIFQKNVELVTAQTAVAWRIFPVGAKGNKVSVPYTEDFAVSAIDSYENETPQLPANPGNRFDMRSGPSGNQLQMSSTPAASPETIEVHNELPIGAISTNIYKAGALLATKTGIAPGQMAQFNFSPTLYLLHDSSFQQGEIMMLTPLSKTTSEISLLGIKSADVVMTGGGNGTDAMPFLFSLANVVYA